MRPEISPSLTDRIDEIYTDTGYASRGELVRDAVRHHLQTLGTETESDPHSSQPNLKLTISPTDQDGIPLGTNPVTGDLITSLFNTTDRTRRFTFTGGRGDCAGA